MTQDRHLILPLLSGTSCGRIFLAASDFGIYEFLYDNTKTSPILSWFHYFGVGPDFRVKKRKLNSGPMHLWSFLGAEEDNLIDLKADNVRSVHT